MANLQDVRSLLVYKKHIQNSQNIFYPQALKIFFSLKIH